MLDASLLLGLLFNPENVGDISLRNVGLISTDYVALYSRRKKLFFTLLLNFNRNFTTGFF
jgi:hypothetical protein